jgi:hypothetical protein
MSLELSEEKFDQGQLILAPYGPKDKLVLWAVAKVKSNGKADLVAHFTSFSAKVETNVDRVPVGWEIISQERAVRALRGKDADAQ